MTSFLAFLGVSIIVIVTPGPDTAITIRNTLVGGRAGGVFTALGIATGQMIWAIAASIGIVAVLLASEPLFVAVKFAGAAYLVYLGGQALVQAFRPSAFDQRGILAKKHAGHLTPLTAFRQGVISDLGNPKVAVFFASLLPQFVPSGEPTFMTLLLLGAVFAVMTFSWLGLYVAIIARAGDVLRRSSLRRVIEGVMGTLLIAMGLRVVVAQR
jgi:threonine/homoserine/homoserine lactone efflux protein